MGCCECRNEDGGFCDARCPWVRAGPVSRAHGTIGEFAKLYIKEFISPCGMGWAVKCIQHRISFRRRGGHARALN